MSCLSALIVLDLGVPGRSALLGVLRAGHAARGDAFRRRIGMAVASTEHLLPGIGEAVVRLARIAAAVVIEDDDGDVGDLGTVGARAASSEAGSGEGVFSDVGIEGVELVAVCDARRNFHLHRSAGSERNDPEWHEMEP